MSVKKNKFKCKFFLVHNRDLFRTFVRKKIKCYNSQMIDKKTKRIVNFFYEIGTLRKIPRSHMQTLLTGDLSDNISSHSFRVCVIGLILASLENANQNKVLLMCLLHDLGESRSGDQNWVHKKFVKVFENEISQSQISSLPNSKNLLDIIAEYKSRKTLEARITKDADRLDQMLLQKEYAWAGNKEAANWTKGGNHSKSLSTNSAKLLGIEIEQQKPSDWWTHGNWADSRR